MLSVHLQLTAFSLQIWYLEGFFLISFLKIFVYLVVLGLSCAHGIFLVLACEILNSSMWDLVPCPGIEPRSLHWEREVSP